MSNERNFVDLSEQDVVDILTNGETLESVDLGYASVHAVRHNSERKVIISAANGKSIMYVDKSIL